MEEATMVSVVAVTGNTYPYRRELRHRGAVWSYDEECYLYRITATDCPKLLELETWARAQKLRVTRCEVPASALEPETYVEKRQRLQRKAAARADQHRTIAEREGAKAQARVDNVRSRTSDWAYLTQPASPNSQLGRMRERDGNTLHAAGKVLYKEVPARLEAAAGLDLIATPDEEQDVGFMQRRIEEAKIEMRRMERSWGADVAGRDYYIELQQKLAHWTALLEAKGGVTYGPHNVKAGDLVKVRGRWEGVLRANRTTITTGSQFNLKYPYAEITEHKPNPNPPPKPKLPPLVNRPEAPIHMDKAEWARVQRASGSAGARVVGDIRVRLVYRGGDGREVFITDMPVKAAP